MAWYQQFLCQDRSSLDQDQAAFVQQHYISASMPLICLLFCYYLKNNMLDSTNSEVLILEYFRMIDICTEHLSSSIESSSFKEIGN